MALPRTLRGHTTMLVVVDKLSKMTHLIPTTVQVTGYCERPRHAFHGTILNYPPGNPWHQTKAVYCLPPSNRWANRADEPHSRGYAQTLCVT
eukprot:911-Pelagomonas_calceolata.AAC.1